MLQKEACIDHAETLPYRSAGLSVKNAVQQFCILRDNTVFHIKD